MSQLKSTKKYSLEMQCNVYFEVHTFLVVIQVYFEMQCNVHFKIYTSKYMNSDHILF